MVSMGAAAYAMGVASESEGAEAGRPSSQRLEAPIAPLRAARSVRALERALRAKLADAVLELDLRSLAALGLPALPAFLAPDQVLRLNNAAISQPARDQLLVVGTYTHPPLGAVSVEIDVRERGWSTVTTVRWRFPPIRLEDLARAAGISVPRLLDTLQATAIELGEAASQDVLQVSLDGEASLGIGPIRAKLAARRLVVAASPPKVLAVEAILSLQEKDFPLLFDGDRLTFDATGLNLRDFVGLFRIPLPPLPAIPLLTEPLDRFGLFPADGDYRAAGEFRLGSLGPVRFAIGRAQGGGLAAVVALYPPASLSLRRLNPALAPFDVVKSLITLGQPAVTLASDDVAAWPVPDGRGGWTTLSAAKGLDVRGDFRLSGFGLEMIKSLTGLDALPFRIPLGGDLSQLRLAAEIERRVPVLPGVLTIERLTVTLSPNPLTIAAAGDATLTLFGMEVPPLRIGATLSAGVYSVFLTTQSPWKKPLGLPFTIENAGLQIDGPVLAYGFFGRITLQNRVVEVAAKFVGQAPTLLLGELQGDFSLVGVVADLTGLRLPFLFEPKLRDAALYIVMDPRGTTIGERFYPRGIGIAGSMSFLGLAARIKLNGDEARLQGEGELETPIRMAPLLEVTGANGARTPSFTIDTSGSPVLRVSARVSVLGLVQEVSATVAKDAMEFAIEQSVAAVEASLKAQLSGSRFAATGTTSCRVSGSIGPLRISQLGLSLGKINLDAVVKCELEVSATGTDDARTVFRPSFTFAGVTIRLPELALKLASLEELPAALFSYIRNHALEVFADIIGSVDKWLAALADKLIDGVEDVAKVLKEHFEQNAEAIARALRRKLNQAITETVRALERVGETTEQAAKALVAIGDSPEDVARALKDLGRTPEDVAKVLRALDRPREEISRTLERAGFPREAADVATRVLFPGVPSVPDVVRDVLPRVRLRTRVRVRF